MLPCEVVLSWPWIWAGYVLVPGLFKLIWHAPNFQTLLVLVLGARNWPEGGRRGSDSEVTHSHHSSFETHEGQVSCLRQAHRCGFFATFVVWFCCIISIYSCVARFK
jgi:hypothetical protein